MYKRNIRLHYPMGWKRVAIMSHTSLKASDAYCIQKNVWNTYTSCTEQFYIFSPSGSHVKGNHWKFPVFIVLKAFALTASSHNKKKQLGTMLDFQSKESKAVFINNLLFHFLFVFLFLTTSIFPLYADNESWL